MNRLKDKHFWLISFVSYLLLVFTSYGFVRDLYFWRDDYALIYQLQQGGLFRWPYQGWSLVYYPLYLLFGNDPSGYFISSLVLYLVLCLVLNLFVWRVTKDRLVAFLAGLIFASGYIGSEIMFMTSVSVAGLVYLLATIFFILFYANYVSSRSVTLFLPVFFIYAILTLLFSQRAHNLIFIAFFSEFFFTLKTRKFNFRRFWAHFRQAFVYTLPFLSLTVAWYFLGITESGVAVKDASGRLVNYLKFFNTATLSTFFSDFGNFLTFPIGKQWIFLSSLIGFLLLFFIFGFFTYGRISREKKRIGFFLAALWIGSYIVYHLNEFGTIHHSSQRYLLFGYPFFAALLAFILKLIFFEKKTRFPIAGFGLVSAYVLLQLAQIQPLRQDILNRSLTTRKFFAQLEQSVPTLAGRSLFYFDVVSDVPTWVRFNDILRVGIYPSEASLASFYKVSMDDVRIVDNYQDFLEAQGGNRFDKAYAFFYSIDRELIDITHQISKNTGFAKANLNLDSASLYEEYVDGNRLTPDSGRIIYKSVITEGQEGSKSLNGLLSFNVDDFPSYTPIKVRLTMKARDLLSEIKKFPYMDVSVTVRPKDIPIDLIHEDNYRRMLLNYIKEREYFRSVVTVDASGYEDKGDAGSAVDGNLGTNWGGKQSYVV